MTTVVELPKVKVILSPPEVREGGLGKDRVLIHTPKSKEEE